MRPERLNYEMEKAFDVWYQTGSVESFRKLLPELKRVYKKYARCNNDYRSGIETYGYGSRYDILCNMRYISDRWKASFRLRWLIDGLESGMIK